jgi:hypothetical protein
MSIALNPNIPTESNYRRAKNNFGNSPASNMLPHKEVSDQKLKTASAIGAITGVAVALSIITKRHGINLFKNNKMPNLMKPSTWKIGNIEYKPTEIVGLAGGSVAGGLAAGATLDPNNKKAKYREALQQMVGNIIIPVYTVTVASKFVEKNKNKLKLPQIKSQSKPAKITNKVLENLPIAGIPLAALAASAIAGNWIANKMSHAIFNVQDHRKIKISDFAGHVDDVCLAAMLVSPENQIGKTAARIIPAALVVPGYQTGIKKQK